MQLWIFLLLTLDVPHLPPFAHLYPAPTTFPLAITSLLSIVHGLCIYVPWLITSPSFIQTSPLITGWLLSNKQTNKSVSPV